MAGPRVEIVGTMAKSCLWLADVVARANQYLLVKNQARYYEFVSAVVVPLIEQVLLESPTPCKESELTKFKAVTAAAALKMFAELHAGISSHEAFAQASADGSRVCIQASWAAVADNARAVKDGSAENYLHYKRV